MKQVLQRLSVGLAHSARLAWSGLRFATRQLIQFLRAPWIGHTLRALLRWARSAAWGAAIAALLVGSLTFCMRRVPQGSIGVRQVNSGSDSGIEAKDYPPGLHFVPRILQDIHLVDGRVQALRFAWASDGGTQNTLEMRSPEGISVSVAAAVTYRVAPGRAHRLVSEGRKDSFHLRVRASTEAILTTELARLSVADWASTDAREQARVAALAVLRQRLEGEHVQALDLLFHGVYFPGTYEKKLQEKQLATQTVRTAQALARREAQLMAQTRAQLNLAGEKALLEDEAQRRLDQIGLDRKAAIDRIEDQTKDYTMRVQIEADSQSRQRLAVAKRIRAEAEASHESLRAAILESEVGRRYQATLAAQALNFASITLDSSDPRLPFLLDIEAMTKVLSPAAP